jgi:hypothetical protein
LAAQGAPLLELRAALAGAVATYDDGSGADADADDTHLMLQAGAGELSLDAFDGGLHCQVSTCCIICGVHLAWAPVEHLHACAQFLDFCIQLFRPVCSPVAYCSRHPACREHAGR